MTLDQALHILVRAHTRDDSDTGFVVENAANFFTCCSPQEYYEAFRAVRMHLHLKVEPDPNTTSFDSLRLRGAMFRRSRLP